MASQRQLKSRIRSVKNTKQITKAMQMVAASKMRRTQDATRASSPYARAANQILYHLSNQGEAKLHRWFTKRPVKNRLIIVIASDKGLAGAYNANILKYYLNRLKEDEAKSIGNKTITLGRKASSLAAKLKHIEVVGSYDSIPDNPSVKQVFAILGSARDLFESQQVDAVEVIYTRFVSSMTQVAERIQLFPAGFEETEVSESVRTATFEPSPEEVLETVAYRLIGSKLFQAMLDSRASEHSMRMLAMKNATDNAGEIIEDLTLAMNKARQASITQEISEISAGVEAIQ